jgi:hypothetical protein
MTYLEAVQLKKQRDAEWDAYYNEQGRPTCNDYEKCINESPENIFNYNVVSRFNGAYIATDNDKGVYEYPAGLLAWGYGIPEDAYVAQEFLEQDIWEVFSLKETFDW